jgi:predicted P-loop ATPase
MRNDGAPTRGPIRVSAVTYRGSVGKRLDLSDDGEGVEKRQLMSARSTRGQLENLAFDTPLEAFEHRLSVGPETMFFSGTFDPNLSEARVVPRENLAEPDADDDMPRVAATKDFLEFREGPGLISIDVDDRSADQVPALHPCEVALRFETAEEVRDALLEVLPEARGCPVLVMPSSSSMIAREADGEVLKGPGGWRIVIPTSDAIQTPRILEAIQIRCWSQERHHYAFVSRGGDVLIRSLADQALARPTQPDYPRAMLGAGLAWIENSHHIANPDGDLFDPNSVTLTTDERHAAARNMDAARSALANECDRLKAERTEAYSAELVNQGVSHSAADRAAHLRFSQETLLSSDFVYFQGGETVAVATLLSQEGAAYDGRQCLDPIEPDYDGGRAVGKFYWNEGQRPGVHSFAHGSRFFQLRYDVHGAIEAFQNARVDTQAVARILALSELTELETNAVERAAAGALALGNNRRVLRDEVARTRAAFQAAGEEEMAGDVQAQELLPHPIGQPLRADGFPQTGARPNGPPAILDHPANLGHMMQAYGIEYRYNEITKTMEWAHPDISSEGDNAENRLFSELLGLASMNGMPKGNLDTHLVGLGDAQSYNPVTDYLSRLTWDGVSRFDRLAATVGASDPDIARIATRVFLIQACAAADHAATARDLDPDVVAHFEYVIVLLSEQGKSKTKGFRKLMPPALRRYYRESVVLKVGDKDNEKQALSNWVVELGELDATFSKSAVAHKKAFLSRSRDEIRAPYARKASIYGRRTVFVGTVNEESFLADETGNRRYIPLTVDGLDMKWPDDEVDQLWAEAWHRYCNGEKWWPAPDEDELLKVNADRYRVRSNVEEKIERHYAWGEGVSLDQKRKTASQIYEDVMPHNSRPPTERDLKTVGAAVKRLWRASGVAEMRGGQLVVKNAADRYVTVNAQSGKNRGWLLPDKASAAGVKKHEAHTEQLPRQRNEGPAS